MSLPNSVWARLMSAAADSVDTLRAPETLRDIQRVLRTNVAAARSIGPSFAKQLGKLYLDMLNVYRALAGFISAAVASGGEAAVGMSGCKAMRAVKKETLVLVSTYVTNADDPKFVATHFVPPLLETVLSDFASSTPGARDAEVLTLMTDIVTRLDGEALPFAPRIVDAVFRATLGMITANFQDYPEHRLAFFRLLGAVNKHCFPALFAISPEQQKLVVDSVVWAFKHTARDIGETGLDILTALLENVAGSGPDIAQPFYAAYYLSLVQDLLFVLTDRLHKAAFKEHATLLRHLFHLVESGAVTTSLWQSPFAVRIGAATAFEARLNALAAAAANGGPPIDPARKLTNQFFVREYVSGLISQSFTNVQR